MGCCMLSVRAPSLFDPDFEVNFAISPSGAEFAFACCDEGTISWRPTEALSSEIAGVDFVADAAGDVCKSGVCKAEDEPAEAI